MQRLGLVATIPILQNHLDRTTGSGDVLVEYQDHHLIASVVLEPQLVGRDKVKGYLSVASHDHRPAPPGAAPSLQPLGGHRVRYSARIIGIVEVLAGQGSPFASCLAEFGQGLTLLLELSRVERVAFQDVVIGSGDLVLRKAA